ncbi:P2Y purinoceptor 1-like [Gambusia affinis]|uniref:P2Y purinoceptor 1-like n=1 Tax=Gambusia affinis TaxID=33528 RepID=UPI001CDD5AF5|nr:P2Y purinoceptor 1-like [Gambusia affinis]
MNASDCTPSDIALFEHIIVPCLYILVFLVGLVLNIWGLKSLLHNWNNRRIINILVLNLGLADMLNLLTHPFLIMYYFNKTEWIFGEGFCLVTRFCFNLNLYCSIGFLTCISVYRYLAVVYPIKTVGKLTITHSIVISVLIWILASVESFPDLFYPKQSEKNTTRCFETTDLKHVTEYLNYSISWSFFGFCIPFVVILSCYGHMIAVVCHSDTMNRDRKRQILKLMGFLILLFSFCYAPYHIFKNLSLYSRVQISQGRCPKWNSVVFNARQASRGLVSLNSALNPLVYLYVYEEMVDQFKQLLQSFRQIFSCCFKVESSFVSVPKTEQEAESAV